LSFHFPEKWEEFDFFPKIPIEEESNFDFLKEQNLKEFLPKFPCLWFSKII